MKKFILLTLTLLSISTASFAKNNPGETTIVLKNDLHIMYKYANAGHLARQNTINNYPSYHKFTQFDECMEKCITIFYFPFK